MKNKYAFYAYIIMVVLGFAIVIALIFAAINIKANKEILADREAAITEAVDEAVEVCKESYSSAKATDEELAYLNEYIENINKYDEPRTKANIAMAMLTNTADSIANKYVEGIISETTSANIQHNIGGMLSNLETAIQLN